MLGLRGAPSVSAVHAKSSLFFFSSDMVDMDIVDMVYMVDMDMADMVEMVDIINIDIKYDPVWSSY